MEVWCAKRSLPPSFGVMKPKPFESLNHFTVPVGMSFIPVLARGCPSFAGGHVSEGVNDSRRVGLRCRSCGRNFSTIRALRHLLARFPPAFVGIGGLAARPGGRGFEQKPDCLGEKR